MDYESESRGYDGMLLLAPSSACVFFFLLSPNQFLSFFFSLLSSSLARNTRTREKEKKKKNSDRKLTFTADRDQYQRDERSVSPRGRRGDSPPRRDRVRSASPGGRGER